ncbi:hypothetical protein [Xanthomonas phage RTH11]|nr:hypothetical protein [Xanthomonas phage RTH11]
MDHSEGIQIPKGVLPQVTRIKPGLALLFKSPQMDVRILNEHASYLDERLGKLRPSFTEANATGDWQSLQDRLIRLRNEAIANKRVFFVLLEPFAQREQMLQALADHVFVYAKCMNTTLFHTAKHNGNVSVAFGPVCTEVVRIYRQVPSKSERRYIRVEVPEGVDQDAAEKQVKEVLATIQSETRTLHQISVHANLQQDCGILVESIYRPFVKVPSRKAILENLKKVTSKPHWPYSVPVKRVTFKMNSDLMMELIREDEETDAKFYRRFDQALKHYLENYELSSDVEV